VLTALDSSGRARWRWSTSARWHSLGGRFATPPSAVRAAGRMWFVGSTPTGALVGRTPARPWRALSSPSCRQAYAGRDGARGIDVFCLHDGRLVEGDLGARVLRTATPSIGEGAWAEWTDGRPNMKGLGAAISEIGLTTMAARVAPYDASGDNLLVRQVYLDLQWRKVRHLHCTGTPAATASNNGFIVACAIGPNRIAWVSEDGQTLRVHRVTTPLPMRPAVGAVTFDDGFSQISAVGRDGSVWLLDVGQGRWWPQGRSATAPVRFSRWTS
jgi:hypothetical protein